jgi:hypothetical protein
VAVSAPRGANDLHLGRAHHVLVAALWTLHAPGRVVRIRETATRADLPWLGWEALEDGHGETRMTDRVRVGGALWSSSRLA